MRLSCNGCRVLRKGCSDSCSIRPCLQWIKSPDAQSNATVFLAKFYGRAGLLNLVNAAPENLRPAVFRSLLYEACGRIVNPIYGSVGLLWSGNWNMAQAAVEAVLKGAPIVQISDDEAKKQPPLSSAAAPPPQQHPTYDIRHKQQLSSSSSTQAPDDADNKPGPGRLNLKKKKKRTSSDSDSSPAAATASNNKNKKKRRHQQDSAVSDDDHQQDSAVSDQVQRQHGHMAVESTNSDAEAAASHVSQADQHDEHEVAEEQQQEQLGLDLTLGFAPVVPPLPAPNAAGDAGCSLTGTETGTGTGWTAGEPAFRFL